MNKKSFRSFFSGFSGFSGLTSLPGLSVFLIFAVSLISSVMILPSQTFASPPNGFGDDSQVKEDSFNIPKAKDWEQGEKLLDVIKGIVNWVLGILAFIALTVLLYGGFLMVTAGGEPTQYEKGAKFLKSALIGIVIIWLARFIASLIFWLVNSTTSEAGSSAGTDT